MVQLTLRDIKCKLSGCRFYFSLSPSSGLLQSLTSQEVGDRSPDLTSDNAMAICQEAFRVFLFETQNVPDKQVMSAELVRSPFSVTSFAGLMVVWSIEAPGRANKEEKFVIFPKN